MKLMNILIFILAVTEVHAKDTGVISFLKPEERNFQYSSLIFSKGSVVEFKGDTVKLLEGDLWVLKTEKIKIETVYGDVVFEGENGFFSLDLKADRLTSRLGNGRAVLKNRGGELIPLDFGEELWLGSMGRDGLQSRGVPSAVTWAWFFPRWAKKFPFKSKIKNASAKIKEFQDQRVETSAQISHEVVSRDVASQKRKEEQDLAVLKAAERRKQQQRKLFFDRVFYR
ncbi:MAG: hypothetical protein V4736_12705 [Bdellovibrionota bacterium]